MVRRLGNLFKKAIKLPVNFTKIARCKPGLLGLEEPRGEPPQFFQKVNARPRCVNPGLCRDDGEEAEDGKGPARRKSTFAYVWSAGARKSSNML